MTDAPEGDRSNRTPGAAGRPAPVRGHGNSVPIGRIAGIPIRMHWTFPLLIGLVVFVDWGSGPRAVASGVAWIILLFACVVVHEISHCLVARRRGVGVLGILLLPIGGLSQLDHMPEKPDDELAVAIVGPLTSLAIGLAAMAVAVLLGVKVWPPTLFAGSWWARLAWLNLLLAAFNLLPALPMDGGRVLRAALARHRSRLEATLLAGRIARVLALAMMVVGLLYDIWLLLIGMFVLLGAQAEEEAARHPHPPPPARSPDGSRVG
jgi:Zn-dependent protease